MEKIKMSLPNIQKNQKNRKLFELDFMKKTKLFNQPVRLLKSNTKLNPANEGKLSGSKQRGMSRQMKKKRG